MKIHPAIAKRRHSAFSLIELMVSVAVLSLMLVIVFQMLEQMQKTWKRTRQNVSEFKDARTGFEEMGRRIGQATMNAYYGYQYKEGAPLGGFSTRYGNQIVRESELHFVCGPNSVLFQGAQSKGGGGRPGHSIFFQAPFGFCFDQDKETKGRRQYEQLNGLLNAWGYFVEFNTDELDRPRFLNALRNAPAARPRYRLMEFRQPTEYLQVFKLNLRDMPQGSSAKSMYRWFSEGLFSVNSAWNAEKDPPKDDLFFRTSRPIAENVVAMIIQPRESTAKNTARRPEDLAPKYVYDTRLWQQGGAAAALTGLPAKTRHVLPPILDISFITVDEGSFSKYALRNAIETTDQDPKFISDELFISADKRTKDFDEAEKKLRSLGLEYRIFNTSIRLRESKWSDT